MSKVEIWKVYTGSMDEVGILVLPFPVPEEVAISEAEELADTDDIEVVFLGVGKLSESVLKRFK